MKVEISYTVNASALGGKNLVTFEELYDFSNPDEPVKVAEHKDIEDDGQTVLITERIIKIFWIFQSLQKNAGNGNILESPEVISSTSRASLSSTERTTENIWGVPFILVR